MVDRIFAVPNYKNTLLDILNKQRCPTTQDEFKEWDNWLASLVLRKSNIVILIKQSTCDVYIRHYDSHDEAIYLAHSAVITSSSDFLRERFLSTKMQAADGRRIIDLPDDLDRRCIDRILDFMYTGKIAIPENSFEVKSNFYLCFFMLIQASASHEILED